MRVWLLHIGEELPVDGPQRLFRYGFLADALQQRGHQVLRWAPTFRHTTKTHRFTTDRRIELTKNYAIQFVYAAGYRRNTSIERLRTYHVLGQRFRVLARRETTPDLIVSAIPSLEWAEAAVDYGRSRRVPVVVDVRDLWPDVFPSALPRWARPVGRLLMAPYYRAGRRACQNADGLAAVSESYLDWALRKAGRPRSSCDAVVPMGFEPQPVSAGTLQESVAKLRDRGIDPQRPVCFFAGALERHHDVETVVASARLLKAAGHNDLQFIICGDGSKAKALQDQARELPSVHFLGWCDAATLQAVSSISNVGLCAYAEGAMISLGNKPFEYMAGRLALVSSLPGELAALIERHQCGVSYRPGDAYSLTRCLAELTSAPERLRALCANSHRAWLQNYRSRDVYARFVDHLTALRGAAAKAA
jgi:glycosyltransferase involved in cell wall biosynthesis